MEKEPPLLLVALWFLRWSCWPWCRTVAAAAVVVHRKKSFPMNQNQSFHHRTPYLLVFTDFLQRPLEHAPPLTHPLSID